MRHNRIAIQFEYGCVSLRMRFERNTSVVARRYMNIHSPPINALGSAVPVVCKRHRQKTNKTIHFLRAPMTSLFSNNKTKNQWTVLQSIENTSKRGRQCLLMQPLMPCTRPDFDEALFNFRIFLKLGAPSCLGPGQVVPPAPPPHLGGPVCTRMYLYVTRMYSCVLVWCFSHDHHFTKHSIFYSQAI